MAILLDAQARAALAHRRARGRDAALLLHLVSLRGMQHVLQVDWWPRHRRPHGLVLRQQDDILIYLDRRVARYLQWQDVTLSAWHLGPWEGLAVVDEPEVTLALAAWVERHPGLGSG